MTGQRDEEQHRHPAPRPISHVTGGAKQRIQNLSTGSHTRAIVARAVNLSEASRPVVPTGLGGGEEISDI